MNTIICLCLVIQLVSQISGSNVFKESENIVSTIFEIFESNFTVIDVIDDEYYTKIGSRVDPRDDELCMQHFNSIMSGLSSYDLWAMKRKFCFTICYSIFEH